eukprot:gene40918-49908_t
MLLLRDDDGFLFVLVQHGAGPLRALVQHRHVLLRRVLLPAVRAEQLLRLFILIGYMGGLLGAAFNFCVAKLNSWRAAFMGPSKGPRSVYRRCAEVCLLSCAMSCIMYGMPLIWNKLGTAEVESALLKGSKDVSEAAVVGFPHEIK